MMFQYKVASFLINCVLFQNSGRYHEDIFGITVGARKTHLEYKRKARLMKDNAV